MSDTIYRAMGKVPCRVEGFWHEPGQECALTTAMMRADAPLYDWSAFGEILEWAENWADGIENRIRITRTWEWDGTTNARQWLVLVTKGPDIVARAQSPDFRTAVLAALESAIGGTE